MKETVPENTVNHENMTIGKQKVKGHSEMQVSERNNESDEARIRARQERELNVNKVMCSNSDNHDARETNENKTNQSHNESVDDGDHPTS